VWGSTSGTVRTRRTAVVAMTQVWDNKASLLLYHHHHQSVAAKRRRAVHLTVSVTQLQARHTRKSRLLVVGSGPATAAPADPQHRG
jgi:predicted deacetylase